MRHSLTRVPLRRRLLTLLVVAAWIGLCLYPDPRPLLASLARLGRPPIDAAAATALARDLPDDPVAIEAFVDGYAPYQTAWALYGLPWYFPTVAQVVTDRGGDCQARAILTASIFRSQGPAVHLPLQLRPRLGGLAGQAGHAAGRPRHRLRV